jgi:hypothetical protein
VRASWGILRDQLWANTYSVTRYNEPFYRALLFVLPPFRTDARKVEDMIGLGGAPLGVQFVSAFRPDFPYYMRQSLNVQREIGAHWLGQASFVGSRGSGLYMVKIHG